MYFYVRNRCSLRSYGGCVSDEVEFRCTGKFVKFQILNIFTHTEWWIAWDFNAMFRCSSHLQIVDFSEPWLVEIVGNVSGFHWAEMRSQQLVLA